jgi:hypothetical protein
MKHTWDCLCLGECRTVFAPAGRFRSVAACYRFSKALKIHVFHRFIESGSKPPHSESFALKKVCGISRDSGGPRSEYMIQFANPRL